MILSVLAPLVREGDQFRAEFTLRNATDRAMDVLVKAHVDGLPIPLAPLARQRRGIWDLTVANAWGALTVEKFSQAFETTPVGGTTTASLGSAVREVAWANTPHGHTFVFPWPGMRTTLTVDHAGAGHPWVELEAKAAIPLKAPLASGYRLTKSLTPVEVSSSCRSRRTSSRYGRLRGSSGRHDG